MLSMVVCMCSGMKVRARRCVCVCLFVCLCGVHACMHLDPRTGPGLRGLHARACATGATVCQAVAEKEL